MTKVDQNKQILFVKGKSQYNAMRNYIDEIAIGFQMAGYNTWVLDSEETTYDVQVENLSHNEKIDIIFTCNAILVSLRNKFPNAYYMTYLCDHPAIHLERIKEMDERTVIFTCDKRHERYIKRYCTNIKYVKFIPLSGSYWKEYVPYKERTRDIVFTGSYKRPEDMYQKIHMYSGALKIFAEYMVKNMVEHSEMDLEEGLTTTLKHFGVEMSDAEFHELAWEYCEVERYVRSYYRDKMIRSLVENELCIHVFGNGWQDFEGKGKENLIIEDGDYLVAQKAVADAKISVNIMPGFKAGFQERIASAMLSGTVSVTDESSYILGNFEDGQNIILYSLDKLEELPLVIKWLLEHEKIAEKIALEGQKTAKERLTWQQRAFEMAAYIEENER